MANTQGDITSNASTVYKLDNVKKIKEETSTVWG